MPVNYYWNPPQGEQTSLGLVKETTPGTFPGMTGAIYHRAIGVKFDPKNVPVPQTGAAKMWGQEAPATGSYEGSGTLDLESSPDKIGQPIAFALGNQSTPSTALVNLALSSATLVAATAFPVGSTPPLTVVPGMTLTFDTSTNQETLTVKSITSSGGVYTINTTSGATKAHAQGVSVTLTGTNAYYSKMTMGLLPYFSAQHFRVVDTVDVLGCMMESMSITMNVKGGLDFKFSLANLNEDIDASPATPAFSSTYPMSMSNPNNWQMLGGNIIGVPGASISVQQLSVQLNNNLDKSYYSGSSGRIPYAFVQQRRSGKGTVTLGFEDDTAYKLFLGGSNATGPKFPVSTTNFAWVCAGQDIIDSATGAPYLIAIQLPNIYPTSDPVDAKATGVITQTFGFDLNESGSGNNDDLTIHYIGSSSSVF